MYNKIYIIIDNLDTVHGIFLDKNEAEKYREKLDYDMPEDDLQGTDYYKIIEIEKGKEIKLPE
jgi:hypothetical protein